MLYDARRLAFQRDHKAFSMHTHTHAHVSISFYETDVRTWASESRWDAGIRDSTYDCKFVNVPPDTALARYPSIRWETKCLPHFSAIHTPQLFS